MKLNIIISLCLIPVTAAAQQEPLQYLRPNNQLGLHVFETDKKDISPFSGFKVRVGGNFTQDFQAITQKNNAGPVFVNNVNINKLANIGPGFNRAMANLNIDAQLEDGIRMNLTMYLSARHHPEAWVKGGYVQFDKLSFLKSELIDKVMEKVTLKIGAYEVDYGDQHFRRTDGGNAIHNPFVENYIMDEFATEIGGEVYYHSTGGLLAVVGLSNGALNPTVVKPTKVDTATGEANVNAPAIHAKLGYDRQINDDLRIRLTGSVYANKSTSNNTLFNGDRTGSHYFFVMENTTATSDANAWSGRYNPQFSQQVTSFMINPFITYRGLELFGTYERAMGRKITEPILRTVTQYAVDLIYRFPERKQNFWIGGRFNAVQTGQTVSGKESTINRAVASAGWFLTKNVMLKGEYVDQLYHDFPSTDIRSEGRFKGWMMEAVIGF
jgi:hypothetical protein